jgi:hypothetical protein
VSITTQIQARPGYTVAERFSALIDNLAARPIGSESPFIVGDACVDLWRPREGHWVFTLVERVGDDFATEIRRTVSIIPGLYRAFEVVDGTNARHLYGEFHGIRSAIAHALDEVTRPVWQPGVVAAAMNAHDECGC